MVILNLEEGFYQIYNAWLETVFNEIKFHDISENFLEFDGEIYSSSTQLVPKQLLVFEVVSPPFSYKAWFRSQALIAPKKIKL